MNFQIIGIKNSLNENKSSTPSFLGGDTRRPHFLLFKDVKNTQAMNKAAKTHTA
jgi:hypothetical protein